MIDRHRPFLHLADQRFAQMDDMVKESAGRDNPAAILFAVSDATGQTARRALQAALAQFPGVSVEIRTIGEVRTPDQVAAVVEEAASAGAVIAHTLVIDEVRRHMYQCGQRYGVDTIDLMGPLLLHLQNVLAQPPVERPGLLDSESIERAEAMSFTVKHDDGQRPQDLPQAEIILVGASRTSKTPISVYLSYHGWRVANLPITLRSRPPKQLFEADRRRVIGLTIEASRLQMLRRARVRHIGVKLPDYTDLSTIRQELMHVLELCHENEWRVVNVTDRSVEEAAMEVVNLVERQSRFTL